MDLSKAADDRSCKKLEWHNLLAWRGQFEQDQSGLCANPSAGLTHNKDDVMEGKITILQVETEQLSF